MRETTFDSPSSGAPTYEASPVIDALSWLRLLQPVVLLSVLLLSILFSPTRILFKSLFYPAHYAQLTFDDDEAVSVAAELDTDPQPTPVIVPIRSRRRVLTQIALLCTSVTYLISGVLIVLRAVIPTSSDHDQNHGRVWTPDLPLWQHSHIQALGGMLAWAMIALTLLIEEKARGKQGTYGRGKAGWNIFFGFGTDVTIFVLYFVVKGGRHTIPDTTPWSITQLAIIVTRLLILYPMLLVALSWDKVKFVRAAELQQEEGPISAAGPSSATERSSLLASGRAAPGYGATESTSAQGQTAKGKKPADGRTAGQADLGLSVSAAPPPPTLRVFWQRVVKLFPYLWPSKSPKLQSFAFLAGVVLLIARFVNLLVPLTLGAIVEDLGTGAAPWWHIGLYTFLKAIQGGSGVLSFIQRQAWIPVMQYSDRMMSMMAFEHLLNLSMVFHTKRKTGEVLRVLDRGAAINNLFEYLFFQLIPIFIDIAVAMVYLTRTFSFTVGTTLFAVMWFYVYISVKLTTWRTDLRRRMNNLDSVSRALHTDVLLNWESVKVFGNEEFEANRYRDSLLEYQKAAYQVQASLNVLNLVQNTTICCGTLATTMMVAASVVNGRTSASQFVIFITYLQQVYGPLNMLGTLYRVVQQNLIDTDKLMSLLEEEAEIKDEPNAKELVVTEGVIEFKDVHFSYEAGKIPALKGLNMKLDAKSSCALVGESGAGKTTILRLMLRFYAPQSGAILIDGQDISKVTQKSLRKAIGIVPQDSSLFNSSIRTNILYGKVNATDEELEEAAKAAQIWDKIQAFPEKMNTVVGERGVRLSGGERQRVSIARAFLRGSPLLLLDEASSSLDSATERSLQEALKTLLTGRTSLTIAHRLSTIINSDVINVISNGQLVESGTHEELVQKEGGAYATMWLKQVQTEKEAEAAARAAELVKAELGKEQRQRSTDPDIAPELKASDIDHASSSALALSPPTGSALSKAADQANGPSRPYSLDTSRAQTPKPEAAPEQLSASAAVEPVKPNPQPSEVKAQQTEDARAGTDTVSTAAAAAAAAATERPAVSIPAIPVPAHTQSSPAAAPAVSTSSLAFPQSPEETAPKNVVTGPATPTAAADTSNGDVASPANTDATATESTRMPSTHSSRSIRQRISSIIKGERSSSQTHGKVGSGSVATGANTSSNSESATTTSPPAGDADGSRFRKISSVKMAGAGSVAQEDGAAAAADSAAATSEAASKNNSVRSSNSRSKSKRKGKGRS